MVSADPVLAIDFGTVTTSAILIADGAEEFIEDPSSHSRAWPSAVCLDGDELLTGTAAEVRKRRRPAEYRAEFKRDLGETVPIPLGERSYSPLDLVTAMLAAVRREAERAAGRPVTRAALTVPASYTGHDPRHALMIRAGTDAGFEAVELLPEPVAAALAPMSGPPPRDGSLVLVYDFGGGTFDTALVRTGAGVLGHAALEDCGGRDIDRALIQTLLDTEARLAGHLTSPRARMQLDAQVVALKHQLSQATTADDDFGDTDVVLALDRTVVDRVVAPFVGRTIGCVEQLLRRCEVRLDEVDEVLLTGGVTRMPAVEAAVRAALGRSVRFGRSRDLSVVQGAAAFAAAAATRSCAPVPPEPGETPLRWAVPGGTATFVRWLAGDGDQIFPGTALAEVRAGDGAIWRLTAAGDGVLRRRHAQPGAHVHAGDWLATVDPPVAPAESAQPGAQPAFIRLGHDGPVVAVAFSPDGTRVLTGSHDETARIWDAGTGEELDRLDLRGGSGAVAWNPAGDVIAVTLDDEVTGRVDAEDLYGDDETDHESEVNRIAWAPREDDPVYAVACADGSVDLVDADAEIVLTLTGNSQAALDVAFGRDGRRLVVGGTDGDAVVFTDDGEEVLRVSLGAAVHAVALSPDDAILATGGADHVVGLWDAGTGDPLGAMRHDGPVTAVAFAPDGTWLLSGATDATARAWLVETGKEVARLRHGGPVNDVAISPDGERIATAGEDGSARVWSV
ncbi:Hsp70 family protein [Dactylosporangium sp. CS-047395]|uniref:Hsp70 family protein n=1 Tax=Dactylosporangium sp. CS-047395 TaxID=3239936 RepID=UPI003D8EE85E